MGTVGRWVGRWVGEGRRAAVGPRKALWHVTNRPDRLEASGDATEHQRRDAGVAEKENRCPSRTPAAPETPPIPPLSPPGDENLAQQPANRLLEKKSPFSRTPSCRSLPAPAVAAASHSAIWRHITAAGLGLGLGRDSPRCCGMCSVSQWCPCVRRSHRGSDRRPRREAAARHRPHMPLTISQQDHADALTFEILPASRNGIAPFPAAEPAAVLEAARASAPAPPVVSAGSLRASVHHIVIPSLRRKSDFFLLTPRPDHPAPNRRAGRVHRHSVLRHHLGLAGALRGESF